MRETSVPSVRSRLEEVFLVGPSVLRRELDAHEPEAEVAQHGRREACDVQGRAVLFREAGFVEKVGFDFAQKRGALMQKERVRAGPLSNG